MGHSAFCSPACGASARESVNSSTEPHCTVFVLHFDCFFLFTNTATISLTYCELRIPKVAGEPGRPYSIVPFPRTVIFFYQQRVLIYTTLHLPHITMSINVLTINVKGLNHPAKRASLWKTMLSHGSDVLCVQETHFAQDATPICQHKSFPHIYKAYFSWKQRGILIAIRDTVSFQQHSCTLDPEGRYIIIVCTIDNVVYTLVNLYAPNRRQTKFLKATLKKIRLVQ